MIAAGDVVWAFRMLLGREPESDAVIAHHAAVAQPPNRDGLRAMILRSAEFAGVMQRFGFSLKNDAIPRELLAPFVSLKADHGEPGCYIDRFGVRTRCDFLHSSYAGYAGKIACDALDAGLPMHEPAELVGMLRAAAEAVGSFAIMELGAGWGPWLSLGGTLAMRRGLPYRLIGVEASAEHVSFMRTHLADNGIDPDAHVLLHAAVGPSSGVARFPRLANAREQWGEQAHFGSNIEVGEQDEIACISIADLVDRCGPIDVLHCDIQGAEADVISAGIEHLNAAVTRVVVGTHGRVIESRLFEVFTSHKWRLDHEQACVMTQQDDVLTLAADGVQIWYNPRLRHGLKFLL